MESKKDCIFCRGEYELFIIDGNKMVVFDVEKLKECNRRVRFCQVCGKELENG